MRMDVAEEYLAKAKEYDSDIRTIIAEINQVKRLITQLEHTQEEELEMLSMIREAYQRQSEEQYQRLLEKLHGLWD